MPTNSFGGWPFGVSLLSLLNEAKNHAFILNYDHLGTTTVYQQTRVAEIVNQAVEEFLEAMPRIGLTTAAQAMSSGVQSYAVPTALHGVAIRRIRHADTGSNPFTDGQELTYLTQAQVEQLPAAYRNGTLSRQFPEYWAFNRTATSFTVYPEPNSSAGSLDIEYRQEPTPFGYLAIASPSTTAADPSAAAGTTLTVASGSGITAGRLLFVGPDSARAENVTVSSINGATITTSAALTYTHTTAQADPVYLAIGEIPTIGQRPVALNIAAQLVAPLDDGKAQALLARYAYEMRVFTEKMLGELSKYQSSMTDAGLHNRFSILTNWHRF